MNSLWAIIIFGVLVIVHEFGHFVVARLKGISVEKFSLGFGPAIFKRKIKDTLILVCLIPLGGYVKMSGDERNQYNGKPDEFFSKPVGTRAQVVFAGPLFNYIFAFVLFWFVSFLWFPSPAPVVGEVIADRPAQAAGVQVGDRIISVNGQAVSQWKQMAEIIYNSSEPVHLVIERGGKTLELTSGVTIEEAFDELDRPRPISVIGIKPRFIQYDVVGSFLEGGKTLFIYTKQFFKGLAAIIAGRVPFRKAAMGPLGIYFLTSQAALSGVRSLIYLTAVLSLSLALINLFPIPVLDGGHIAFFLLEKIRKRPLALKTEEVLNRIGLALLGTLFIFVFYNDIKRGPHFQEKSKTSVAQNETVK